MAADWDLKDGQGIVGVDFHAARLPAGFTEAMNQLLRNVNAEGRALKECRVSEEGANVSMNFLTYRPKSASP